MLNTKFCGNCTEKGRGVAMETVHHVNSFHSNELLFEPVNDVSRLVVVVNRASVSMATSGVQACEAFSY